MGDVRVWVVSDQRLLAEAMRRRFSSEPDLLPLPLRPAADAEPVEEIRRSRPDVIVFDAMSHRSPWPATLQTLRAAAPGARVVLLAATDDADDALLAVRADVAAWLPPGTTGDELVRVVQAVPRGSAFYPAEHLGVVLRRLCREAGRGPDDGPVASLSRRELEVLACLVEGHPGQVIAERLDMAPNTVRTHTNRIFRKLGVHSRLEAVRIARDSGVVPGAAGRARVHLVNRVPAELTNTKYP